METATLHLCTECGLESDQPVWHCAVCHAHWPMTVEICEQCHEGHCPQRDGAPIESDFSEALVLSEPTGNSPKIGGISDSSPNEPPTEFVVKDGYVLPATPKSLEQSAKKEEAPVGSPSGAQALGVHPIALVIPAMSDEEYGSLLQDIREQGLKEPIWVYQGQIIDGRHRYRACLEVGIEPATREWDGQGSLVSFILSLNLRRRHLSSGQKAALATEVLPHLEAEAAERKRLSLETQDREPSGRFSQNEENENRSAFYPWTGKFPGTVSEGSEQAGEARERAARLVDTNPRYVSEAKRVQEKAPEIFEKVKQGEINLPEAKRQAGLLSPSNLKKFAVPDLWVREHKEFLKLLDEHKLETPLIVNEVSEYLKAKGVDL
ncbi:ParB N-terminal domain-containing protein [Candidatus Acetothermia bacterium]|nr:ParB N-terminal domain-containing protein [Candidatus Acetothermia bacterium]